MSQVSPIEVAVKQHIVNPSFRYSICTLVTNLQEYGEMLASFTEAGFTADICEYRYIDNSADNSLDAYRGLNLFLQESQGEYIILCHQDIILNFDRIDTLERRISEVTRLDPDWAILSNAGGLEGNLYQRVAMGVVYPNGQYDRVGKFPQKVVSVDEHFIIVKKSANLALSHNLSGFHLYGTDLCLIAELLGYNAYAIDFKLTHKSLGNADAGYYKMVELLKEKYRHFMRSRRIVTTIADFYLSILPVRYKIADSKLGKKVARKLTKWKSERTNRS